MKNVKRILILTLCITMIASLIVIPNMSVSAATVSVDGLTETENFDDLTAVGGIVTSSNGYANLVETQTERGKVYEKGSSSSDNVYTIITPTIAGGSSGHMIYSFDIKIHFEDTSTEQTSRNTFLCLGDKNDFQLLNLAKSTVQSQKQTGSETVPTDDWYNIKLDFDIAAETVDVYLQNAATPKFSDISYAGLTMNDKTDFSPEKGIKLFTWINVSTNAGYKYYLDNLNIQYQPAVNVAQQTFDSSAALFDSLILYHNASQEVVNDAEKGSVLRITGSSSNSRINIDAASKLTGYDKTKGKLVYSFDVKAESPVDDADRAVTLGLSKTDTTGSLNQSLVYLRSNKVSCEGQSGAYTNGITDKGWYKVELIFDLEKSKYTCKVNDADFKTDVAYTSTDYDPAKYLGFHLWVNPNHTYYYYLDNLKIGYYATTDSVKGINVDGAALEGFAEGTKAYSQKLYNTEYAAIDAAKIAPVINSSLRENYDYYKTVTVTESGSTKTAKVSVFPFGEYTVSLANAYSDSKPTAENLKLETVGTDFVLTGNVAAPYSGDSSYCIIIATYDGGALADAHIVKDIALTAKEKTNAIPAEAKIATGGKTEAKAFLWDGFGALNPICSLVPLTD